MDLTNGLTIVLIILRAVIAVVLTRVALSRSGMRGLHWLSLVFYGNAFIFSINYLHIPPVFYPIGLAVVQVALAMFIHETFYQDRASPYLVFLFAAIVGPLAPTVISLVTGISTPTPITPLNAPALNWLWHIVVGYQAYKVIAKDRYVEDWVKARYLMMVAYSIIIVVPHLVSSSLPGSIPAEVQAISQSLTRLGMILSIMLQFLVWVMPEPFRRWLNRNYKAPVEEKAELGMSEDEIMSALKA